MSVLSPAAVDDEAALRSRELGARQDRVINFVYRATLSCGPRPGAAEQRTEAVFRAAPDLLADPDLDDAGYRARLMATVRDQRPCRTAVTHAAYLDQRDTADPARAHVWGLLVRALMDRDSPAGAVAAATARSGIGVALVRERFIELLRAVATFTAHLPADTAECTCP